MAEYYPTTGVCYEHRERSKEIGPHHRATVGRRGYFGVIDDYLGCFYDEKIMAWLDRTLPGHLAAAAQ